MLESSTQAYFDGVPFESFTGEASSLSLAVNPGEGSADAQAKTTYGTNNVYMNVADSSADLDGFADAVSHWVDT